MKDLGAQTHYEVLEVAPDAPLATIRASYERLRRLLGPDSLAVYSLVEPAEADALLLRLDEAWAVLSDEGARRRYDASLGLAPPPPEEPAPSTFADAVARIGASRRAAGEGAERATSDPPAEPEPAATAAPPEGEAADDDAIALDDGDLLEVVEIADAPAFPAPAEPERALVPLASTAPAEVLLASEVLDADEVGLETEGTPLAPDTVFTGELLRRLRMERGLTLDRLAARTRIGARHFANIEEERWAELPERVYLRGYLEAYARELHLDVARVCSTYLARMPTGRKR